MTWHNVSSANANSNNNNSHNYNISVTFSHWSLGAIGKVMRGEVSLLLLNWGSRSGLYLYSPGPGTRPLPALGLCTCFGKLHASSIDVSLLLLQAACTDPTELLLPSANPFWDQATCLSHSWVSAPAP